MPNDCWNKMTLVSEFNPEQLAELYKKEFEEKNIPKHCLTIHYTGKRGIRLTMWSRWGPDNEWLKRMLENYPECWIKNDWYEEGGGAGIFIGGYLNGVKQETIIEEWEELCIGGVCQLLGGSD
tara:strand:+ start:485 stop:853 length:369 start_codon:yes stop_codon:yes gene_type:complete